MRIIDAHNHPDWHGHDFNKSLENMDRFGIEKTWLLSWESPHSDYCHNYSQVLPSGVLGSGREPVPFTRCLSYKERAPERFILGYCPDPREPDACRRLIAAHDIYGAQVCGELKVRMMYDNPDALMLFHVAASLKMPVTFHLQYDTRRKWDDPREEWYGGSIDTLERVLQACPDTIFLGHAPGFWIHISGDDLRLKDTYPEANAPVLPGGRIPELLRKYPNLYCDISAGSGRLALSRDLDFTKKFLIEFHDRILYARDYFDNKHQELLNSLSLPVPVLEDIYFRNAERLLAE